MMRCYAAWEVQVALLVVNPLLGVDVFLVGFQSVGLMMILPVEDYVLLV